MPMACLYLVPRLKDWMRHGAASKSTYISMLGEWGWTVLDIIGSIILICDKWILRFEIKYTSCEYVIMCEKPKP